MILNEERTHGFNIDLQNYDSHFPYFEFTQSEQSCDKFATVYNRGVKYKDHWTVK